MKLADLPTKLQENIRLKHASGILTTDINGESVILNLISGQYSSLNSVGSLIWQNLSEENSMMLILEAILRDFDVDRETARVELVAFLDELLDKKMITARESTEQS